MSRSKRRTTSADKHKERQRSNCSAVQASAWKAILKARRTARQAKREQRKAREKADPSIAIARAEAKFRREMHNIRVNKIRDQIVGERRRFPGTLMLSAPDAARGCDHSLLQDIEEELDNAAVYWTDGAQRCQRSIKNPTVSYMGAGVVWLEKDETSGVSGWRSKEFLLGRNTGSVRDTEFYAVSAAMLLAVQEVKTGKRNIQHVRVLTDRRDLLQGIPWGELPLGPLLSSRLAIQDFYESADWLAERGIKLDLVWVKGHSKSLGNKKADRAAKRAATAQESLSIRAGTELQEGLQTKVPKIFNDLGDIWREEWLWRANKDFLAENIKSVGMDAEARPPMAEEQDCTDDEEVDMNLDDSDEGPMKSTISTTN